MKRLAFSRFARTLAPFAFAVAIGCNSSGNFSGSGSKASAKPKPALDAKPQSPGTPLPPGSAPGSTPTISSEEEIVTSGSPGPAAPPVVIPDNAVTQGSFTAWPDPARPRPGEDYWIHVEVKLPANSKNYTVQDLSGRLIGTDGYERGIGRDSKGALGSIGPILGDLGGGGGTPGDKFELSGGKAHVAIWVPGAAQMVKDTIEIRSDLLRESQRLSIVFE